MTATPLFNTAFRDYVVDGMPASGVHKPSKGDIRDALAVLSNTSATLYGNVADGNQIANTGTNNASAMQDWLDAVGSGYFETTVLGPGVGFLPAGVFKFGTGLTIPSNAKIMAVPGKSVLFPSSAVSGAALTAANGMTLDGIVVDGYQTSGKNGLSIGAAALINNVVVRNCVFARFLYFGSGTGFGVDIQEGAISEFQNCDFQGNSFGFNVLDSGAGTPTTVKVTNSRFKANIRRGLSLQTGQECRFTSCVAELNGEEGVYVNLAGGGGGSATVMNILFDDLYCESNQQGTTSGASRHAKYHMYLRGNGIKVRDSFFAHGGDFTPYTAEARAVQFDQAQDAVFDHNSVANEAGQISIIGSDSRVQFPNWRTALCGAIGTTVTVSAGVGKYYAETSV